MWLTSLTVSLALALASPSRVEQLRSAGSAVEVVQITPGLVTVLEFPKPIIEVRVGDPKSLKVQISSVSPKELTLSLKSIQASSTNLIVRSGKRMYVLDIVASKAVHKDLVRIRGGNTPSTSSSAQLITQKKIAP